MRRHLRSTHRESRAEARPEPRHGTPKNSLLDAGDEFPFRYRTADHLASNTEGRLPAAARRFARAILGRGAKLARAAGLTSCGYSRRDPGGVIFSRSGTLGPPILPRTLGRLRLKGMSNLDVEIQFAISPDDGWAPGGGILGRWFTRRGILPATKGLASATPELLRSALRLRLDFPPDLDHGGSGEFHLLKDHDVCGSHSVFRRWGGP